MNIEKKSNGSFLGSGENTKFFNEDEIDLMDLLGTVWKWKFLIIGIVILSFLASFIFSRVRFPIRQVTTAVVSLRFPGIEKFQNPDGSLFDRNQLITPFILQHALASMPVDSMSDEVRIKLNREIRSLVSIYPIPAEIEKNDKNQEDKDAVFPNAFRIVFSAEAHYGIAPELMADILTTIVGQYKKNFIEKFAFAPLIVQGQGPELLENSDYDEVLQILRMRLNSMIQVMTDRMGDGGYFLSRESGLSFVGLILEAKIIQTQLVKIEAILQEFKLSKDKTTQISRLRHKIETFAMRREKKAAEAMSAKELLREIRKKEETVRVEKSTSPTTNFMIDGSILESIRKNDYYAFLIKAALEAEVEARNDEVEIRHMENTLKKILNNGWDHDAVEKKRLQIVQLLKQGLDAVELSAQKVNQLNAEYVRHNIDGSIQMLGEPENSRTSDPNRKRLPVLTLVMSGFLSILLAFFTEAVMRRKTNQSGQPGRDIR